MILKVEAARYEGGELILKTSSPEARRLAYKFRKGEYELKQSRPKRSLDANAMAWAIIHQIAAAVKISPVEVYRDAVKDIADATEVVCIQEKAVDSFKRLFIGDHVGRQVDTMPSKIPGCVTLLCTYGSSDYDTRQMSILIDNLLQDAASLGIPTPEDEKINSLLEEWEGRHAQAH